jgi:hypothetical protein
MPKPNEIMTQLRAPHGYFGRTMRHRAANAIEELEARLNRIEAHVLGLVRTHSQFAAAAEGSWSGKKQRVRAAEAAQILAFIRKEKDVTDTALEEGT